MNECLYKFWYLFVLLKSYVSMNLSSLTYCGVFFNKYQYYEEKNMLNVCLNTFEPDNLWYCQKM